MAQTSLSIGQFLEVEKNKAALRLDTIPNTPKIVHDFLRLFGSSSYNNEDFGVLAFHSILGCALRDFRIEKGVEAIDARINLIWVQVTGTGKSKASNIVFRILRDLGFSVSSPVDFSDAAMVGSISKEKRKKGDTVVRDVGDLEIKDMVYFDDTIKIFSENNPQWRDSTKTYIRKSLDTIGYNPIEKIMRSGRITFFSNSTVIVSTYHFNSPEIVIDESGTAQRFLILPRHVDEALRIQNTIKENESYSTNLIKQESFRKQYDKEYNAIIKYLKQFIPERFKMSDAEKVIDLIETGKIPLVDNKKIGNDDTNTIQKEILNIMFENSLEKQREKIEKNKIVYLFSPDTLTIRNNFCRQVANYIATCSESVRNTVFTFYNRMLEYSNKLALHRAVLRGSKKYIEISDIEYGHEIIKRLLIRLIMWIEDYSESDTQTPIKTRGKSDSIILNNFIVAYNELIKDKELVTVLDGKNFVLKTTLFKAIEKLTKKSKHTIRLTYWPKVTSSFIEKKIGKFRYVCYQSKIQSNIKIQYQEEMNEEDMEDDGNETT